MVELGEEDRIRLTEELKRRIGSGENVFYSELPIPDGPARTIGIGSWRVRSWPRADGPKEGTGLIELSFLHIRPEERGKGFDISMIEHAICDARAHFNREGHRLRKVYAQVPAGNQRHIDEYLRAGFTREALLTRHYSDDYDIIIVSRFLD